MTIKAADSSEPAAFLSIQAVILTVNFVFRQALFPGDLADRFVGGHAFFDVTLDMLFDERHRLGQIQLFVFFVASHDDDHLTFELITQLEHFADLAADELFVFLGQLTGQAHLAVAQDIQAVLQHLADAMGSLVENEGHRVFLQAQQLPDTLFLRAVQKAVEQERLRRKLEQEAAKNRQLRAYAEGLEYALEALGRQDVRVRIGGGEDGSHPCTI